jgi:hypothetical protein
MAGTKLAGKRFRVKPGMTMIIILKDWIME